MKTTLTICAMIAISACQNVESNSTSSGNDTIKTGVSVIDSSKIKSDTTKVVKVLKTDSLLNDGGKIKVGEANVTNIKSH